MEIDNINYMETHKPLVSILLAIYKPKEDWLIEQLISLNNQTYDNIELLIYDDCPDFPINEEYFKSYIINFPYKLIRGAENQGSNKAFEELTKVAEGDFLAYCDQDDIWEKEKITLMVEKILDRNVTLVCSDLSIIDENGKATANSITEIRKRHEFKSGYNLAQGLLMSNFVTGCAMMVKKEIAKKSVPFEETLIHDQWISIIAAINGKIEFIEKPLVKYRQHSCNQTGILAGICDKQTYYNMRIQGILNRYVSLKQRLGDNDELRQHIDSCLLWIKSRKDYFFKPSIKDLKIMIKYRRFHKMSIIIESILPFTPNSIFRYIIKLTKKGVL
ncbi:glycosyltransferase [Clostridium beijerinckii]|uniref:glycosyltransferase n=1 Tax=Clostridium beijerinckii TaxID=1520 RepID=UPI001835C449|nr:glycosyltransferase [Clostridium beijerinckii]NOW06518.1 glycosyltransferase involved in cell wall biosynthesis [Clostridium beijerinckii]NOW88958.1 glycosyltransferase involved in cell wall biosynthesis [Clostridium beijerinckii]NYC00338.1 glycosyltransferase involved in cell wall biosynthesis [Clostridium beijerinckii]